MLLRFFSNILPLQLSQATYDVKMPLLKLVECRVITYYTDNASRAPHLLLEHE